MLTLELPAERKGREPPAELLAWRQLIAVGVETRAWRPMLASEQLGISGVEVIRFGASGAARGTVLHMHGGSFRLSSPDFVAPFAERLAATCGVEVICPRYRLAPENPFPAGLADVSAVYTALANRRAAPIVVSGDSAGGGLAASLTLLAVARGIAPRALMLLSAWLDLTVTNATYETNADTDLLFSRKSAKEAAELYLQGLAPEHPLASPVFASLDGFPPTLISVGSNEVLAGDSYRFRAALQAAGVPTVLSNLPDMEHVAVTRDFALTGAEETFELIKNFLSEQLASTGVA
jgi:epsilon-lactone hydrolase